VRGIILARLGSNLASNGCSSDYEDLCSEVRTRLLFYLHELKANLREDQCRDFRAYVASVAHNVCHDYFRQLYPARARLQKRIRDLLHTHPNFAIWKPDEDATAEWICGFESWLGRSVSSNTAAWLNRFHEDPERVVDVLAEGGDIQGIEFESLIGSVFTQVREPVRFSDLVDLVADIRGVRDLPVTAFDGDETSAAHGVPDSNLRIDSVLEMRECLTRAWEVLCQMPRKDCKAYLLHARDASGENLINLFLHCEITTEEEVARLLDVSPEELTDLVLYRLPLENEEIAEQLGITLNRLYRRRYRAGIRLKAVLTDMTKKI
jgi:RNA polymerase sigma factor (sigma-70 family)